MPRRADIVTESSFNFDIPQYGKTKRCACKYCGHEFAYSASRGKHHLSECESYRRQKRESEALLAGIEQYTVQISKLQLDALYKQLAIALFTIGEPFTLFEHPEMRKLLDMLNPAFRLPLLKAIGTILLDDIYKQYKLDVRAILDFSEYLNIVFDLSVNAKGERVFNISVHVPHHSAFY